ncbi:MAG: hypothetical protein E7158_02720 [Firmicutes bacterium]|nr:hypothetical protein [Bacillota bacterium]
MLSKIIYNKNKILMLLGGIIFFLLVILSYFHIFYTSKVSNLEKIKLEEISNGVTKYLECIDNNEKLDGYIIYILKNNNKDSMTIKEIINKINNTFNKNISKKDILNIGITSKMIDEKITYDFTTSTFSIDKGTDIREIAAKEIVSYKIKDMYKKSDKYIVKYDKLLVKDPYKVLNYYNDNNKLDEVSEIQLYLQNKGSIDNILKYINKNNAKKIKDITITYTVKNNKVLIEKIEEK